jgi:hypothetical protein
MARQAMWLTLVVLAVPAVAQEAYRDARVRYVEPGVVVQRAAEAAAEDAVPNLPFLPGDRAWTDATGRVEMQFADGSVLRLDSRTKLDFVAREEAPEQIVVRLWSGSLHLVIDGYATHSQVLVETPGGLVRAEERGSYRVDASGAETWLTTLAGSAVLESQDGTVRVAAGERAYAQRGEAPGRPEPYDPADQDEFARWNAERDGQYAWAARSTSYLPEEVAPYAADLEDHGTWYVEAGVGNVWRPHVGVDWQPYTDGRWVFTSYGWTWVPYEPWGWAPFHYGSWDFSLSLGWYWIPDAVWGPAWVSWSVGPRYVGWCPSNRWGRPAHWDHGHDGHGGGRAVRRGHGDWNYVERDHFGSHDVARRRVSADQVRDGDLRVLDSGLGLDRRLEVSDRAHVRSAISGTAIASTGRGRGKDPFATIPSLARARGGETRPLSSRARSGGTSTGGPKGGLSSPDPSRGTEPGLARARGGKEPSSSSQQDVLRRFFGPLSDGRPAQGGAPGVGRSEPGSRPSQTASPRPASRSSSAPLRSTVSPRPTQPNSLPTARPVHRETPRNQPSRTSVPSFRGRSSEPSRRSAPSVMPRSSEPSRRSAPSVMPRSSEPSRRSAPSVQPRASAPSRGSAPSAGSRSGGGAAPSVRTPRSEPRSAPSRQPSSGGDRARPRKEKG